MKQRTYFSLLIALMLFLMSCAPEQGKLPPTAAPGDDERARHVLVDFLQSLHDGQYDKAAQLYGGTYQTMIDHNPSINPNDHSALLRNACAINGAQCLLVKSAGMDTIVSETQFVFNVELLNADGTLFVLGPCCGGNETDFPPQSAFHFMVLKVDKDRYVAKDMPPYAP